MPAKLKNGNIGAPGGKREGAGRPPDWLKARCKEAGPEILEFLIQVATGADMEQVVNAAGETIGVPAAVKDRIKAAEVILDRGHGKPNQAMELTGADGAELSSIPPDALSKIIAVLEAGAASDPEGGTGTEKTQ